MSFPCSKCGACCRRAHMIDDFPEPLKPDGSCVHLKDNNECAIYKDRPDVCRIGKSRDKFPYLTDEEYKELNIRACNAMMDADGMDETYKIKNNDKP